MSLIGIAKVRMQPKTFFRIEEKAPPKVIL
jgi:hypothetical protein